MFRSSGWGRISRGEANRYQTNANRKPASARPMRSIDQSPTLRPRSLPVRAALCTTIALLAFQQGNPPRLSCDELSARYLFCMRLRTVRSKTVSWQTYGVSTRSGHGIGSNGSCGFYQALWAVRGKVRAFWIGCRVTPL